MRVHLDCFPCFFKQTAIALRLGTTDERMRDEVMKAVACIASGTDTSKPPAHITTFIHRRIREMLGRDPFEGIKAEYNALALGIYPRLKEIVKKNADPLGTAARLAIAGNVIDFGIFSSVDIEATIERALNLPLAVDDSMTFVEDIASASEILYLLDNAGEIVFDKVLIEALVPGKKVTAVVKGGPIINDCTRRDAAETGLDDICEVIDNGSDAVGTIEEMCSTELRDRIDSGCLIISKGQGNYETLSPSGRKVYYLFQSKCDVVSRYLGLRQGAMLLASGERYGSQ